MTPTRTCPQCGAEYDAEERFCARDGAALRGDAGRASLVGEVLAERYLVQARLGEGGMGEVYRAEHVRMRRPCAVKVLRAAVAGDPDAVSRFNREAANASRVAHPNVAAVYDFGETSAGLIYLAMELVDGRPLRALLDEVGALPPARALTIAAQIAGALDAAHALGIVHRDLKPDNVMLAAAADGADVVKVVDFGIAKGGEAAAQQVTRTGLIVGTPEFMSPEQLAGDAVDARSDVYALALLAYAMLTGAHAFPAETVQDTLVLRLTTSPRRLAELRPDVPWPAAVQAVLDRGLARRPEERTPTAGELARALISAYEAASGVGLAATSPEATTQILPASVVAIPATRVAPARVAGRRPGPRRLGTTIAAAGVVAAAIGLAAWRGGAARDGVEPAPIAATVGVDAAEAPAGGGLEAGAASNEADPTPASRGAAGAGAGDRPRGGEGAAPTPSAPGATRGPTALATVADPGPPVGSAERRADDVEARVAAVERLLQSEASEDAAALAGALREADAAARDAAPGTRAWDRAQVSRALVLYALEDARWCEAARAVPLARAQRAVRDGVIRTLFEQIRPTECAAPRVRADSGVSRP